MPECITTNRSPHPSSVRSGDGASSGTTAEPSLQSWIVAILSPGTPSSSSRSFMSRPIDTTRSALSNRADFIARRPPIAAGFVSTPSCTATSGKMSFVTSTNGTPRSFAARAPISPTGGGSVSATTTSGRFTASAPAIELVR